MRRGGRARAGYDPAVGPSSETKFANSRNPAAWLFSGWNWTAKMLSRATAQVKAAGTRVESPRGLVVLGHAVVAVTK